VLDEAHDFGRGGETLPEALEEVVDGLDPDLDGSRRLVFVKVFEAEVRRAGPFDDPLDDREDRGVVTAPEADDLEGDEVRMTGGELRPPQLPVGVFAVCVLPDVRDVQRV